MSNIQSIIVYRNPVEAQFWESGMSFPIMVAMVLSLLVAIGVGSIIKNSKYAAHVCIISVLVTFGLTLHFM